MKKILAEISVGELLDKLTILEIKLEKINDKGSLKIIECLRPTSLLKRVDFPTFGLPTIDINGIICF